MPASTQLQRAIVQIQDKHVVPEIDFTQHVLDDGTTVSTQERQIKDVSLILNSFPNDVLMVFITLREGSSSGDVHSNECTVLLTRGPNEARCRVFEESFLS